jgi:hypothetical protein
MAQEKSPEAKLRDLSELKGGEGSPGPERFGLFTSGGKGMLVQTIAPLWSARADWSGKAIGKLIWINH